MSIPSIVWVAIVTGAITLMIKVLESYLEKKNPVVKQRDYRAEIQELTQRIDALEDEVDRWRNAFYLNEEEIVEVRKLLIQNGQQPPPRRKTDVDRFGIRRE